MTKNGPKWPKYDPKWPNGKSGSANFFAFRMYAYMYGFYACFWTRLKHLHIIAIYMHIKAAL